MPKTMETISRTSLYNNLDDILDKISEKRMSALVTKNEQPIAVILPYETYQQLSFEREQRLHQTLDHLRAWTLKNAEILKGLDSVQLIREIRNEQ